MKLPTKITEIVKNLKYTIDDVGKSGDTILLFEEKYVLKISNNIEVLTKEYEKNKWLYEHLPCSKPIVFLIENNKAYYLREFVKGKSLIAEEFIANPEKLIDYICEAFLLLKNVKNCPFNSNDNSGNTFIHGDICLPNILVNNNKISGFIDLDNSGNGDIWYDYCWILWSLMRNLKTKKYNDLLLNKLGIKYNEEKFNQYIPDDLKEIIRGM